MSRPQPRAEAFTVGQVLYFRGNDSSARWGADRKRHRVMQEMTITAVGRKWLTVKRGVPGPEGRVDKVTLDVDGGDFSSPGRCYRTERGRDEADEVERLWDHIKASLPHIYWPPPQVDSHAIKRVLAMLGIALPQPATKADNIEVPE